MKTQQLNRICTIISQWFSQIILSPIIRRYALFTVMCTFALVMYFLCTVTQQSALFGLHTQVFTILHQINKVPFWVPWP